MDVIVTKWVGLEGTAILATEHRKELSARYAQPFLDKAAKYIDYLSIRSEAAVAAKSGVAAMHDLSEGGVFGALWELGQCSGVGLEIDLKKIPIRQETIEICEFFGFKSLQASVGRQSSSGSGRWQCTGACDPSGWRGSCYYRKDNQQQ